MTPLQFWALTLIVVFAGYLNHLHLHEIGCQVGVTRLCHSHWW